MRIKMIYISMFMFLFSVFYSDGYARSAKEYAKIVGANPKGGKEITPFVGDKDLSCPKGHVRGMPLPNPFKNDKKLYTIDHTNVNKYKDRLSAGQILRLKRNKKFFMHIYPTRRTTVYPEVWYTKTIKNKKTCEIGKNNNLIGFNGGVPFPKPKNGAQAAWNMKKMWLGDDVKQVGETRRVVSPSGRIKKEMLTTKVLVYDKTRLTGSIPNPKGVQKKIHQVYTYPADVAGQTVLIIQYIDDTRGDDTWLYLPTLRRVRRAPSLNQGAQIDGESTMDEMATGFRGLVGDWNWKLLGKKEMYVSSNCYDMWKIGGKDKDECWKGDINPTRARYELRRMWVIEGTLRKGLKINHPYSKRVEHCDEDTWFFSFGDRYDRRGNVWRLNETYSSYDYCQKTRMVEAQLHLNLESGRYELYGGSRTKKTVLGQMNTGIKPKIFTVQSLRRAGR